MEAALLIFGQAHKDESLIVHSVCLAFHERHDALLNVFEPEQHLLEELIEQGELLIRSNARHCCARCLDLLVAQLESFFVLSQNAARRLLLDFFEQFLNVWHFPGLHLLRWPH